MKQDFENDDWIKGPKETGFVTPANYFEGLGESINARIITEKLKSAISTDGFEVPENYFENLQANILSKTTGKIESDAKPKTVRLWTSGFAKYAAAACILVVSGVGVYIAQHKPVQQVVSSDMATEQMLYDIDEQVIIDHISNADIAQPKSTVNDTALESYILNNYSQSELVTSL